MKRGRSCTKWFHVALWSSWWLACEGSQLEDCSAYVQAPSAFAAVEGLMRHRGIRYAAYALAYAEDRSLTYRGYRVRVRLDEPSRIREMVGYQVYRPSRRWSRGKGGEHASDVNTAVYPLA